ncbi:MULTISPECIES: hypothetical protein [Mesorhizobium]|uniref:Uncharacterized protein n=3 Tax=Mesorhizobium TaxID=68287 RepID=A0ABU4YKU5_9HYPH|nr:MULTISPECIES: hypothetical protein [unclassified Mesorhizobium]MDX8462385.1 hypothetical protein [Mesorhizobium sp. VK2D]MDX8469038.1 hypothetical protein [Mesorhizobium sp. VK23B]MDX8475422.1 hypothetical protein [Mesorhizobium sp. VK23A]MDX8487585.1 hypothetical protein [Mesorhizobium sp. VK2B]MDX8495541.1 hypothetical protein [Mesorhizobium sp. VK22B]
MRQQTKPFVVEKKMSRKLKTDNQKTSIWGKLDLTLRQILQRNEMCPNRGPLQKTSQAGTRRREHHLRYCG